MSSLTLNKLSLNSIKNIVFVRQSSSEACALYNYYSITAKMNISSESSIFKTESTRKEEKFSNKESCKGKSDKNLYTSSHKSNWQQKYEDCGPNDIAKKKKYNGKDEKRTTHANISLKKDTDGEKNDKTRSETIAPAEFGPALPPHMLKPEKTYGPYLPSNLNPNDKDLSLEKEENVIGPIPVPNSSESYLKLEQRAIEIKLKSQSDDGKNRKDQIRDEWMTTLPELRKVTDMGLTARQFKSKESDIIGDRSVWTDTPFDREIKPNKNISANENIDKIDKLKREHRDFEQEIMARKHKKKHKRDVSLLDMHQKKSKKEKLSKKNIEPVERRPWDRESDLKLNRFDESLKKSALKKAQLLDTRFKSGQSKYL